MTIGIITIGVLSLMVIALQGKCNYLEIKLDKATKTALNYMNIERTRRRLDRRKHYRRK